MMFIPHYCPPACGVQIRTNGEIRCASPALRAFAPRRPLVFDRHPGIAKRCPGSSDFGFGCVIRKSMCPGFRRDDGYGLISACRAGVAAQRRIPPWVIRERRDSLRFSRPTGCGSCRSGEYQRPRRAASNAVGSRNAITSTYTSGAEARWVRDSPARADYVGLGSATKSSSSSRMAIAWGVTLNSSTNEGIGRVPYMFARANAIERSRRVRKRDITTSIGLVQRANAVCSVNIKCSVRNKLPNQLRTCFAGMRKQAANQSASCSL